MDKIVAINYYACCGCVAGHELDLWRNDLPLRHFRDGTSDAATWRTVFDGNLYGVGNFKNLAVVDVGAHIGSFSCRAAEAGARRVLSVEANPENFSILRKNVAPYAAVEILLSALDHTGASLVAVSGGEPDTGRVSSGADARQSPRFLVPTVQIDKIFEQLGGDRVHVLKMDCQGAEWQAFNAASSESWQRVDEIVGEIHADLHFEHFCIFAARHVPAEAFTSPDTWRLRARALVAVSTFLRAAGFEVTFSLDEEDDNTAEFHALRRGLSPRCQIPS